LGISRRRFLAQSGMTTMAVAMRRGMSFAMSHPDEPHYRTQLNAGSLAQFVDPLPLPQIIQPSGRRPSPENAAAQIPYYRVPMRAFEAKVLHLDQRLKRAAAKDCWWSG
jgi:spore coat protein A, manganese oxidase